MLLLELQTDQLTNFQMSRVSLVRSRAGIGSAGARFLAVAVSVSVADAQIWAGAVLKQVNGFRMLLMELQTAQFSTSIGTIQDWYRDASIRFIAGSVSVVITLISGQEQFRFGSK